MYDGITEYWVTVRERGSYEEEHEMSEMHKSTSKAAGPVNLEEGCFDKIKAAMPCQQPAIAADSNGQKKPAESEAATADQNRQHVKRFMDSLLRLSTKLKSLRRDIRDNYKVESSLKILQDHITQVESQYDLLNEEMAKGENAGYGKESMSQTSGRLSSRATAAEQKVKHWPQVPRKSKQFFDKKEAGKNSDSKKPDASDATKPARSAGRGLKSFVQEIGAMCCGNPDCKGRRGRGLLNVVAKDLRHLFEHGIVNPLDGQRYFFCIVNVMGDWPFIQRAGHLARSFYNAAKHASGVDKRLELLTERFQIWCDRMRLKPHIRKLSKENLSWPTTTSYPSGVWSKGHTTRVLNKWFIAECNAYAEEVRSDRLLTIAYRCSVSIEKFLKGLYSYELWIPSAAALEIADYGLNFLMWYGRGAREAFQNSRLQVLRTLQRSLIAARVYAFDTLINPLDPSTELIYYNARNGYKDAFEEAGVSRFPVEFIQKARPVPGNLPLPVPIIYV
ncbi:unnamed protein product [Cladocopium goreaui]|uniref:Uncharacterized protein n=1 Tax=Cladocopium goreaui TaxID=2562237 RepID=A0A9P1GR12_9DINO|nr:unnamed protein product [Cladocopium goreaui]